MIAQKSPLILGAFVFVDQLSGVNLLPRVIDCA